MKRIPKILLTLSAISVLLCVLIWKYIYIQTPPHRAGEIISTEPFFDTRLYAEVESQATQYSISEKNHIVAVVVPHHLLALRLLSSLFTSIKIQQPKTILVIGPDHAHKGKFELYTTDASWQTQFRLVEPDMDLIRKFELHMESNIFYEEHSIGTIIPYIARYFPNARVVPILVAPTLTLTDIEKHIEIWKKSIDITNTLIVVSVDFSHGVTREKATEQDKKSLEILDARDIQSLKRMEPQVVDSPQSLIILMKLLSFWTPTKLQVLEHTDSSEFQKEKTAQVTSYYTLLWSIL